MLPGLLITALLTACIAVLGCWAPRRPRPLALMSFAVGQVVRELPLYPAIWIVLALAFAAIDPGLTQADAASVALAGVTISLLAVVATRGAAAGRVLTAEFARFGLAPVRPALRGLIWPFPLPDRSIRRIADIAYGPHRQQQLDVWMPRSAHARHPVLVLFHGGGYFSGGRRRTSRALLTRLARDGWVCVTADYRLRPTAGLPEHLADGRAVLAWARQHSAELGASESIVLVGASAGAHLAALLVLGGEEAEAVVGFFGYYGPYWEDPSPRGDPLRLTGGDAPPFLLIDGGADTYLPPDSSRAFAEALRGGSSHPVLRVVLPGAQHNFDLIGSVRFTAVVDAVRVFLNAMT